MSKFKIGQIVGISKERRARYGLPYTGVIVSIGKKSCLLELTDWKHPLLEKSLFYVNKKGLTVIL